jgi:hypothetical protein
VETAHGPKRLGEEGGRHAAVYHLEEAQRLLHRLHQVQLCDEPASTISSSPPTASVSGGGSVAPTMDGIGRKARAGRGTCMSLLASSSGLTDAAALQWNITGKEKNLTTV